MKQFLKGALHVHTNLSDGNLSPQEVVKKHKEHNYDFIVWTDHKVNWNIKEHITDDMGMVMIGGVELDVGIKDGIDYRTLPHQELLDSLFESRMRNEFQDLAWPHMNALGVYDTDMHFKVVDYDVPKTYENMIDVIYANDGIPMINHPNWWFCSSLREVMKVDRNFLLELGVGDTTHPGGNFQKEGTEVIWDTLLTQGKTVFGTATDDGHRYEASEETNKPLDFANGFVGVWAEKNEQSIMEALRVGDFYASNGIELEKYEVTDKGIYVKVKPDLISNGHDTSKIEPIDGVRYAIMFKGRMGFTLETVYGTEAFYEFKGGIDEEYVRVKVVSNKSKWNYWQDYDIKYFEACYTQPVYQDKKIRKI